MEVLEGKHFRKKNDLESWVVLDRGFVVMEIEKELVSKLVL